MANQDLIFPILPRPLPKVEHDQAKVRQVSERPVIANSDQERHQTDQEQLDRVARSLEQRERQRKRHPQSNNKKLKKLHQLQQKLDDDMPHLDIEA